MTFGSNVLPKRFGAGPKKNFEPAPPPPPDSITPHLAYVDAQGNPHFFKP